VRLRADNTRLLAEADHATADTVAALEQQLDDADRLSTTYASTLSDTRKELADVSTELAQALAKGLQLEVLITDVYSLGYNFFADMFAEFLTALVP
jgi:hypothetical protein